MFYCFSYKSAPFCSFLSFFWLFRVILRAVGVNFEQSQKLNRLVETKNDRGRFVYRTTPIFYLRSTKKIKDKNFLPLILNKTFFIFRFTNGKQIFDYQKYIGDEDEKNHRHPIIHCSDNRRYRPKNHHRKLPSTSTANNANEKSSRRIVPCIPT